jgi:hypothetical protein
MTVGACGEDGVLCCPTAMQALPKGCNLSGRKKQDPHFYYKEPAAEGGGLALPEAVYMKDHKVNGLTLDAATTKEPQGALWGTSGIDKFNREGGSAKGDGPTSCKKNPWAKGTYKAKQCYSSTGLTSAPEMIDEYWTECGFGDKDKWYTGNGSDAIVMSSGGGKLDEFTSGYSTDIVRFPPTGAGGCANVAPANPTGFVRTDAGVCNIQSEWGPRRVRTSGLRANQKTTISYGQEDGGDPAAFRIGSQTDADEA